LREIFLLTFVNYQSPPRAKLMELTTHLENNAYTIVLKGDLDASNALVLDQAIDEAYSLSPRQVWIDCGQLHYISSAGLGVLISHLETFSSRRMSLVVSNMSPKISEVFHVLGLDTFFTRLPSRSRAVTFTPGC
jgi:anti-sigma B factor antagonist